MRKIIGIAILILCITTVILFLQRCNSKVNISKEELGKLVFFDNSLSEPPGQSCATCHRPERGFVDTLGRDISEGAIKNLFNKRNSMTIAYSSHVPPLTKISENGQESYIGGLFWDGRADSLAHQAGMPFLDNLEMANQSEEMVVLKILKTPYYKDLCNIYGDVDLSGNNREDGVKKIYANVLNALAAYQASNEVNPFNSKYDEYLAGKYKMTEAQQKGFELFKTKGLCAECHILDNDPTIGKVLFTDYTYDNLGIPKNPDNPFYKIDSLHNPLGENFIDIGLQSTTQRAEDLGKFRVPTLRNIEKTAPYGHNGYFKTLIDIVHFYNVRDISSEYPAAECPATVNKDELGNLGLSIQEELYLVEFLKMFTDKIN